MGAQRVRNLKDFSALVFRSFKQFSKDEEARFRLMTAFKITMITVMTYGLQIVSLYGILAFNLIFFQSQGYPGQAFFTETFYDFLLASLLENSLYIGLSLILILIVGIYVGHLLLRPFRLIGEYCENYVEGRKATYDPDFFSDLNLLARFSEYFFHLMENFHANQGMQKMDMPLKYARIRKPVFEKGFFLHFFLIIIGISIGTGVLLSWMAMGLYEGMITLAGEVIPNTPEMKYFLTEQSDLWSKTLYLIISVHVVSYVLLALHLYALISVPAFGLFATMRAFLKGNYSNRVHLIGYSYLRPHCRLFNKYLDFMQRELIDKQKE